MYFRIFLLYGFIWLFAPRPLVAQVDTVLISSPLQVVELTSHVEYFNDPASQSVLPEVINAYAAERFYSAGRTVGNFSGLEGTLWFRFVVRNTTSQPIYLKIANIFIEHIQLFTEGKDGITSYQKTGYLSVFESRHFPSNQYILKIDNGGRESVVVYGTIRADAQPPLHLPMVVGTLEPLVAKSRDSEFISIAVLGIMLAMLFYNFSLFIIVKDRLYLFYCLYIAASLLTVLWFTGFAFEWIWPNEPTRNPSPWLMSIFYATQLLFGNQLLRIGTFLPVLSKVFILLLLGCLVTFIGAFIPFAAESAMLLSQGILISTYFLFAAILLIARREKVAYIFAIGWAPIMAVTVLNILMAFNILSYSPYFDTHAVELALTWELIIFSLALGYRYNLMRKEKVELQAENLQIMKEQKALLRRMVFEQTEEIMAQNDQLLRNQEEIKLQNERLETQNKAYERLKEMILRQNQELESAVAKRTIQLAQSNEELKRHFHQLEQFSFIAAHNLRAPVARILGLASILDQENTANPDNVSILDKITISARDLDMIIHDLGAILDAQKNPTEKAEPIKIQMLINKIFNRFEAEIENDCISFQVEAAAKVIVAIPAYLDSILTNLISNSIKYKSEIATPLVAISTIEVGNEWKIVVQDNGLGFDSKLFSRKLFEPFQRFHTHKDGKGLGMFLVKTQVLAMKGAIELTSEPGVGTRVEITLPKIVIPEFVG